MQLRVRFSPVNPGIAPPAYQSKGASGFDLPADIAETLTLEPRRFSVVPTGLYVAVPFGFELQVRPRSGLAARYAVTVVNSPGTVDADYRGEIKVLLINHGEVPLIVSPNMRVAQAVIAPVIQPELLFVDSLDETERGSGGFGSTGV